MIQSQYKNHFASKRTTKMLISNLI